ncbi:amino acid adenylation domain-containing protein [Kitasatospora sp. NPDC127059]|uniref:amino acid adenylation domain-containing protein n=1 Tax=unclassified Kitasatospora TaxID=2633591 RepID=UPI003665E667
MEGTEPIGAGRRPDRDGEATAGAAPLDLATDRPRLTAGPYRGETESVPLPAGTTALLVELGRSTGVPAAITLLTVWAAVLHRHTGQTDLLLGLAAGSFAEAVPASAPTALPAAGPTAGRAAAPTTGSAGGPGIRPLRLELRPDAPFAEELLRCRAAAAEALGSPPPATAPELRAVAGRPAEPELRAVAPDLALALADDGGALALHYNASLISRATAGWILGHCLTLLSEAVAKPGQPLRDLRVQDGPVHLPEWRLPVPAGHRAPAPAERGEDLVDRFRRTARAHGERPALTGPSGTLSYAALDRITSATARRLRRVGGPGKRVALLCAHDLGSVVGVWSVLKSGAAYVPLDPRQPDARLTRLLLDAEVGAVVCDPELADRAAAVFRGRHVLPLDLTDPGNLTDPGEPGDPGRAVDPGAPAYLLHTSGSTGKPKAVTQTRHNVLTHGLCYADRLRLGPGDQVPLLARYTFDAAVMDLYGALLTGATLHVLDPLLPAPELRGRLAAAGASIVHCTPTLFRHLTGDLPADAARPEPTLAAVRAVVLGGEEATQHDLRRFLGAFPEGSALVNGLGPTECTLVTQHLAGRADLGSGALPVGHPVDGVRIRLVDQDGHPTELCGELEIHSERVAEGYWRQPDVTATAFGTGPDGTPFYRTGDLVRRRADGALVFRGRKDRQIKIRGHRIEPGEIEAVLRGHPTVAEAVLTVDTRQPVARLVGYVTPATAFPPDPEELRRYLARTLPEYAVPWRLLALERMPLGPTGKLDRSALPAPEEVAAGPGEAPRTATEIAVAAVWCRVLGVPSADLHGNFMASGGDSIRLLELLSALQDGFGVELDLVEVLAAPTVATMATLIEREN